MDLRQRPASISDPPKISAYGEKSTVNGRFRRLGNQAGV
jgi:hypothetical protein